LFSSFITTLIFKISLLTINNFKFERLNSVIKQEVENIISDNSTLCFYRFPTKNCSIAFALIYNKGFSGNQIFDGIKILAGDQVTDYASEKEFEYLSKVKTKNINKDILLLKKSYKFPSEILPALKSKDLVYENDKVSLFSIEYYLR